MSGELISIFFNYLKIIVFRQLLKERQQEDEEFCTMPKFVTSAYKKKLEEEKKWEYEDKLAAVIEERTSVASAAGGLGLHGFYKNLLTRNIAMGSSVQASATSAYTAGSERQKKHLGDTGAGASASTSDEPLSGGHASDTNAGTGGGERGGAPVGNSMETRDRTALPLPPPSPSFSLAEPAASVGQGGGGGQEAKEEKVSAARQRYLDRKLGNQNS